LWGCGQLALGDYPYLFVFSHKFSSGELVAALVGARTKMVRFDVVYRALRTPSPGKTHLTTHNYGA